MFFVITDILIERTIFLLASIQTNKSVPGCDKHYNQKIID